MAFVENGDTTKAEVNTLVQTYSDGCATVKQPSSELVNCEKEFGEPIKVKTDIEPDIDSGDTKTETPDSLVEKVEKHDMQKVVDVKQSVGSKETKTTIQKQPPGNLGKPSLKGTTKDPVKKSEVNNKGDKDNEGRPGSGKLSPATLDKSSKVESGKGGVGKLSGETSKVGASGEGLSSQGLSPGVGQTNNQGIHTSIFLLLVFKM